MDDGELRARDRASGQANKRSTPALSNDEILALHAAVIAASLASRRRTLLVGIDKSIVASLPEGQAPSDQIMTDIHELNAAGILADGTEPVVTWLKNAAHHCGQREQSDVFNGALRKIRRERENQKRVGRVSSAGESSALTTSIDRGKRSTTISKQIPHSLLVTSASLGKLLNLMEQCVYGPMTLEVETVDGIKRSSDIVDEVVTFAEEHSSKISTIHVAGRTGFNQHVYIWLRAEWPLYSRYELELKCSAEEAAHASARFDALFLGMMPSYDMLARFPIANILFASVPFCLCVVPILRAVLPFPAAPLDHFLAISVILVLSFDACVIGLALVRRRLWPALRFSLRREDV